MSGEHGHGSELSLSVGTVSKVCIVFFFSVSSLHLLFLGFELKIAFFSICLLYALFSILLLYCFVCLFSISPLL